MDPFLVVMGGAVLGLLLFLVLLGLTSNGIGGQSINEERRLSKTGIDVQQLDDIEQMMQAANERRRRAGQKQMTKKTIRETLDPSAPSDEEMARRYASAEIQHALKLKNQRRRARGLPEITEQQLLDNILKGEE